MKIFLRRSISILLAIVLLAGSAMAEKVLVMTDAAVYATAGDTSSAIGTLPAGATVVRDAEKNGWSRVKNGKYTAYMKSDALAVPKGCKMTAYATQDAALYKSFSTDSKKLATVGAGKAVQVGGYAGEWVCARYDGKIGFMKMSSLTTEAPKQESQPAETMSVTAYAAKDGAKVYNRSGKVVGKVPVNTTVTVKAVRDGLCLVERGGATAVMYQRDLSTEAIAQEEPKDDGVTQISPTTFYVKNDGAKVYDASGKVIGTLSLNAAVTVTAYNDTHAQVSSDGHTGLMARGDLSSEKISVTLKYGSTGEAVEKVQQRLKDLGYFGGTVGGNYLDLTQSAVKAFQKAAGLSQTGEVDAATLQAMLASDAPKYEAPKPSGSSSAVAAKGTAVEMDWWKSDIQSIFSRGTTATITDVDTGIAWHETRSGGTNHADVQPTTAEDTAAMKKAAGSWSWARRAIFVTIDGKNYAASMNCMPHGSGSISGNNFNGHHCIHFTNSRTHGSNKVCSLHQNAIKKALKATL